MTLQRFAGHVARAIVPVFLVAVGSASAQSRPGGSTGETAVSRPAAPAPAPSPTPSAPAPTATASGGRSEPATPSDGQTRSGSTGRPRRGTGAQVAGPAVPRAGGRPTGGGDDEVVIVPGGYGFYPWGYGGLGLGGYYGGYGLWDPWSGYGSGAASSYYDPRQGSDEGGLRIRVSPREASVYLDGYFVGHVDDFDGLLQKLHLSTGPHRIELRNPQYESLFVDVNIEPDQTITYRGEMQKTR